MKKLALTIVAALALIMPATAFATPGAVNKQGCHGKPKHCHSKSEISKNSRGPYVPFGQG